jgi:uncharacterized protein (UPF0335 family)
MAGRKPRVLEARNIPSDAEIRAAIEDIERMEGERVSAKSSYMSQSAKINARQNAVFDDMKSRGVPKKSLQTALKKREMERKLKALEDALEDDDKAVYVSIEKALGDFADLPLGAAAVSREAQGDATTDAIIGAVKADMSEAEWDAASPRATH